MMGVSLIQWSWPHRPLRSAVLTFNFADLPHLHNRGLHVIGTPVRRAVAQARLALGPQKLAHALGVFRLERGVCEYRFVPSGRPRRTQARLSKMPASCAVMPGP